MKCAVEECESEAKHKGLCGKHYKRLWRHGNVKTRKNILHTGQPCANKDCIALATIGEYCHACYQRKQRTGTTDRKIAPRGTGEPITQAGYILLTVNGVRVYKHRQVMEKKLGRKLLPGEIVHHVDGNTLNNEPDNLQLFASQSDHMKHHRS